MPYRAGITVLFACLCSCTQHRTDTAAPPPKTTATCTPVAEKPAAIAPTVLFSTSAQTGWFSSPIAFDLDQDGTKEIIAPFYDVFVFAADGSLIQRIDRDQDGGYDGRIYAPAVLTDLEGDGAVDLVIAAGEGAVRAFTWSEGAFVLKPGWESATTCIADSCFEVRSLAADDLDGDGSVEVVVSDTRSESPPGYEGTNPHVFVFSADGTIRPGWPRYDTTEQGRDLPGGPDGYCAGHNGYGSYGINVAIGDLDDDSDKEIAVTYDNHHIQVFQPDGRAMGADPAFFTNRESGDCFGEPMSVGQFIRWFDPEVEAAHYRDHSGPWPHPTTDPWLQWTKSPPTIADIDGDGTNELVGVPNVERGEPYETIYHALVVLQGDYAAAGHAAGRRWPGWETPPHTSAPQHNDDWYPPEAVPAPVAVNLTGDARLEILFPDPDGHLYAYNPDGTLLWRYDYTQGKSPVYASEPAVADIDGDGALEVVFGTYGEPGDAHGRLVILRNDGTRAAQVSLPNQDEDSGNGVGAAAAPTVTDLEGDGQVEILVLTIDHGLDVFTVPGSACGCTPPQLPDLCGPWPTGRGSYLRTGAPVPLQ